MDRIRVISFESNTAFRAPIVASNSFLAELKMDSNIYNSLYELK